MSKFITRYPLSGFNELIPLLMRCFPEFWEARLAEGNCSFPYDLKLFAARLDGKLMGCIGIHEYQFIFDGMVVPCGGVSDVAVDPDYRGRGYARQLQEFAMKYCREHYKTTSLIPLYTDKPAVYTRLGWQVYESDDKTQISTADFPPVNTFKLDKNAIASDCLRGRKAPRNDDEKSAVQIMAIYRDGKNFNGKCLRSAKTWLELFSDRCHHWQLEENSYFLYREETLIEAYSRDPGHKVNAFTPRHGGHDDNKVMINLSGMATGVDHALIEAVKKRELIFPAADVF